MYTSLPSSSQDASPTKIPHPFGAMEHMRVILESIESKISGVISSFEYPDFEEEEEAEDMDGGADQEEVEEKADASEGRGALKESEEIEYLLSEEENGSKRDGDGAPIENRYGDAGGEGMENRSLLLDSLSNKLFSEGVDGEDGIVMNEGDGF